MIQISVSKAHAKADELELLTSGMSKAVDVKFNFSNDWENLNRTAVFTNGVKTRDVVFDETQTVCSVPSEVLEMPGASVMCGVYGYDNSGVIIPTVYVWLGTVKAGADPSGDENADPSLPVYAHLQQQIDNHTHPIAGLNKQAVSLVGITDSNVDESDIVITNNGVRCLKKCTVNIHIQGEVEFMYATHNEEALIRVDGEKSLNSTVGTYKGTIAEGIRIDFLRADSINFTYFDKTVQTDGFMSHEQAKALEAHISDSENPHGVTAAQVGAYSAEEMDKKLSNIKIDNVSNALKGDANGRCIYLDDVSPIEHDVKAIISGVEDPTVVSLSVCGKNLAFPAYAAGTVRTVNGITFTYNDDGSITLNGTNTSASSLWYPLVMNTNSPMLAPAKYTVSMGVKITSNQTSTTDIYFQMQRYTGGSLSGSFALTFTEDLYSATFTASNYYEAIRWNIRIPVGMSFDNVTIYPLLERGETATEYEPSVCSVFVPDKNGVVDSIKSLLVMNMFTNSAEAVLSAKYNADTNILKEHTHTFDYSGYNVPVIEFTGDTTGISKDNKVTLNYKYGDRSGTCTLKWQGSSSIQYPKKNYTVVFDEAFEAVGASSAVKGDKAQIAWGVHDKYCLKADWIDFSHCRNVVSATLWGEIVKTREGVSQTLMNLPNGGAIDGFPCFVVINGVWQGIYNFNIPKEDWMLGMSGASEKEAILCGENASAGNQYKAEASLGTDFSLEYNSDGFTEEEITASLNTMINTCIAVNNGEKTIEELEQYIDISSVIDYYIFTVLVGGIDIFGKNQILATNDGVKWFMSAYDLDSTFGLYPDGASFLHSGYLTGSAWSDVSFASLSSTVGLYKAVLTYKKAELVERYEQLRKGAMSVSNVADWFYNYAKNIPSAAFDAEAELWKTIPSTASSNVSNIIQWYSDRVSWVDNENAELEGAEPEYKVYVDEKIGDIDTALDELHAYAQGIAAGGVSE